MRTFVKTRALDIKKFLTVFILKQKQINEILSETIFLDEKFLHEFSSPPTTSSTTTPGIYEIENHI